MELVSRLMNHFLHMVSACVSNMELAGLSLKLAESAWKVAVKISPLYSNLAFWTRANLMGCLHKNGRYEEVLRACDEYGDLCLSSADIRSDMSEEEHIAAWRTILHIRKGSVFELGSHRDQTLLLHIALEMCDRADPTEVGLYFNLKHSLANNYNHVGRYEEAQRLIDELIKEVESP